MLLHTGDGGADDTRVVTDDVDDDASADSSDDDDSNENDNDSFSDDALTITRKARAYVDIVCSVFYLPEHSSYKFHRFATEQELTRATINVDELMKHGLNPRFDSELAVLG